MTRAAALLTLVALVVGAGCSAGSSESKAKPATQCSRFAAGTIYAPKRLIAGCATKPKAIKATRATVTKCKDTPTIYALPTGWQRQGEPFVAAAVPQVELDKCSQGLVAWQFAQDKAAIVNFWRGVNDASNTSRGDFINYSAAHNYQFTNGYHNETVQETDRCLAQGYHESNVLDENSITPQPGWIDQSSGVLPDGRIYIMTVTKTVTATEPINGGAPGAVPTQVHLTVLPDGSVKWFSQTVNC